MRPMDVLDTIGTTRAMRRLGPAREATFWIAGEGRSQTGALTMSNSLERGLAALELIADRGDVRLAELATELEISRATAFRILAALQNHGYVEHARAERSYRLGPALGALAARSDSTSVIDLAALAMAHLRVLTPETINLALLRRGRLVYVSILDGAHLLRMSATVGDEVPLHATALGKAVLAAMPPPQQEPVLGAAPYRVFTERTITRPRDLERDLALTRERGYALDNEEQEVGAACVAAAILGRRGFPIGAISVAGLAARLSEQTRAVLGRELRACCDRIALELGYGPPPVSTDSDHADDGTQKTIAIRGRRR